MSKKSQQGVTLIVVLLFLMLITLVGIMAVKRSTTDLKVATADQVDTFLLNSSDSANKRIEKIFGGIAPALQEVQKLQLGAAVAVICAGAGLTLKPKEVEALEEEIYDAGISEVTPPLVQFLLAMLNPAAKTAEQLDQAAEESAKTPKK